MGELLTFGTFVYLLSGAILTFVLIVNILVDKEVGNKVSYKRYHIVVPIIFLPSTLFVGCLFIITWCLAALVNPIILWLQKEI